MFRDSGMSTRTVAEDFESQVEEKFRNVENEKINAQGCRSDEAPTVRNNYKYS